MTQESVYRRVVSLGGGLGVIALIGGGLRAITSPWTAYHPDSGLYLLLAKQISNGSLSVPLGSETGYYQPLFSIATALFGVIFRNLAVAACLVSIVSSAALIVLTGLFAKNIFRSDVSGLIAAALVAVHPTMIHFGGVALTESLYTALLVGCAYACWSALDDGKPTRWLLSGALLGLAYLTRVVGFFEAFVPAAWAIFAIKPRKESLKSFAAFLVGAILLMAPYVVYLSAKQDALRLTGQQGLAFYNVEYRSQRSVMDGKVDAATGRMIAQEKADKIGSVGFLFGNAPYLMKHAATSIEGVYSDLGVLFTPLFAMAMGLGLATSFGGDKRDARGMIFLFSWWAPAIALQALTGTAPRYYVPLVPFGAAAAGRGLGYIFEKTGKIKGAVVVAIVLSCLLATARFGPDPDADWTNLHRAAGDWIARNAGGNYIKVMAREPYIAYFAGGELVPIPANETLPNIIGYAEKWRADYIVVDSMHVGGNILPQIEPLLDSANSPPGWIPAWTAREEGRVIHIYKRNN